MTVYDPQKKKLGPLKKHNGKVINSVELQKIIGDYRSLYERYRRLPLSFGSIRSLADAQRFLESLMNEDRPPEMKRRGGRINKSARKMSNEHIRTTVASRA